MKEMFYKLFLPNRKAWRVKYNDRPERTIKMPYNEAKDYAEMFKGKTIFEP